MRDWALDDPIDVGDAFRYRGEVWQVVAPVKIAPASMTEESPTQFLLRLWPNGEPLPAHIHGES